MLRAATHHDVNEREQERGRHLFWLRLATVIVLAASCLAAAVALFANWGLCLDGTHNSCRDGYPKADALVAQTILGPFGILPATFAVWLAWRKHPVAALGVVVLVVLLYVYWALLLDQATDPGHPDPGTASAPS